MFVGMAGFLIGAIFAAAIGASPVSMLGVEMGAPLSIPECERGPDGFYQLIPTVKHTCWVKDNAMPDADVAHKNVWLSNEDRQAFGFLAQPGMLDLIDGRSERFRIGTQGLAVQREAMAALIRKFGKPTSSSSDIVQNAFGAKYRGYSAYWRRPGLRISFDGLGDSIDRGEISIETDAWVSAHKAAPARSL